MLERSTYIEPCDGAAWEVGSLSSWTFDRLAGCRARVQLSLLDNSYTTYLNHSRNNIEISPIPSRIHIDIDIYNPLFYLILTTPKPGQYASSITSWFRPPIGELGHLERFPPITSLWRHHKRQCYWRYDKMCHGRAGDRIDAGKQSSKFVFCLISLNNRRCYCRQSTIGSAVHCTLGAHGHCTLEAMAWLTTAHRLVRRNKIKMKIKTNT